MSINTWQQSALSRVFLINALPIPLSQKLLSTTLLLSIEKISKLTRNIREAFVKLSRVKLSIRQAFEPLCARISQDIMP